MQKAFLIGIQNTNNTQEESQSLLNELAELVSNLQIQVIGSDLVKIKKPHPHFLIGSGKTLELIKKAKELNCQLIALDCPLSPAQQRNWEKESQLKITDRNEIILDIFEKRATTKEASLQVELAKLEYLLPRLKRAWTHLSRQRGGGTTQRGDGETQLEIDQRLVRNRISLIKKELLEVIKHRQVQRKKRIKIPIATGAIVGYTNAGKSSLLNTLTQSQSLVEDKLFATLDPSTRKLVLPHGKTVLITDTVGFIRRLPHSFIEAFKATLEEVVVSDFLIHVIDITNSEALDHFLATLNVLDELGCKNKPTIVVFNKTDLSFDPVLERTLNHQCPNAIKISTKTNIGITNLIDTIEELLTKDLFIKQLVIPYTSYEILNLLHKEGSIISKKEEADAVYITAKLDPKILPKIKEYIQ